MAVTLCRDVPRLLGLRSLAELPRLIQGILEELRDVGYSDKERFGIRMALEEALVNAIKHGHRGDTTKTVRIRYHVSAAQFTAEIQDEGGGFQPEDVPDPLDPRNFDRPSGRGLLLIEHYMTWVERNHAGNCVTMCKIRS
jgi:serine/threonine-protein kinase RsbW